MQGDSLRCTRFYAGLLLAVCFKPIAWSAEWDSSFEIAPELVFTDNVCLEEDKQSEWVGSLTPELRFTGVGQRAAVDFAGSLQFHTLDNNDTECRGDRGNLDQGSRTDSPIPALQFTGQTEIVEDWLYLSASAAVLQNAINQFRAAGNDGLNRSGNLNTTEQYRLNPYVLRRFKDLVSVRVSYSYDEQQNSEDVIGDSTVDTVDAAISSVSNGAPFSWSISAYSTKVEFDDQLAELDDTSELAAVTLQLGLQLSPQFQVNGSVGEEDNDFPTVDQNEDTDGSFWDVGFLYVPNNRISLAAGIGDRFFGSTPRLEFSYRHKRSVFVAQYSKGLEFTRNLRGIGGIGSQTVEVDDEGGIGFGSQLGGIGAPTGLARTPIVDERFTLGYTFTGRRHSLDVQASNSEQITSGIEQDFTLSTVSVLFTRALGRSSSASIRLFWDERKADNPAEDQLANDSETWTGAIGYTRSIREKLSIGLEYQYTDRDSELLGDSFKENRVVASLNVAF